MRRLAPLLTMVLLAGCGEVERSPETKEISIANPHSDQLKTLTPDLRNLGLMRAIRDNGRRCKRVVGGNYQQQHQSMAMWVAQCEDGRYWSLFIAPNADVQVRECADMSRLGLPQCRPPAATP